MKKIIYLLIGVILVPVLFLVVFIAIPLFLLFLLILRMFTFRKKRMTAPPPSSRNIYRPYEVYDIECEVLDEKDENSNDR